MDTNSTISNSTIIILILIGVWTLPWKGVALWKAAKRGDLAWFIIMFILNTAAILEIIYIFAVAKKSKA